MGLFVKLSGINIYTYKLRFILWYWAELIVLEGFDTLFNLWL